MKHLFLIFIVFSLTLTIRAQKKYELKFKDYFLKVENRPFEHTIVNGSIIIDTINKKISFKGIKGRDFSYVQSWKDKYFYYYANIEIGQLMIAEDEKYARLELTNGTEITTEFHNLNKN